ncbi:MAG TPA: hypothetical protein V6D17_16970 [Candidatus Obscuribacterales bacterium]
MHRKYDVGCALIYFLLLIGIAWPFLFDNQVFYLADVTYNFEPIGRFVVETFRERGGFTLMAPLWNPYIQGGAPEANVMWPFAYVPGYLSCALSESHATAFLLIFHLFVAGYACYLWRSQDVFVQARDKRVMPANEQADGACVLADTAAPENAFLHHFSAMLAGMFFMLSGYMVSCTINLPLLFTACWTPLLLFLIDRTFRKPGLYCLPLIGLAFGQQLSAGRPELALGAVALYFGYAYLAAKRSARGTAAGSKTAVILFLAGISLGVLYDAVNILPLIQILASNPQVSQLEGANALLWSANWFDFLTLLLSQPLGPMTANTCALYPTYPSMMPYIPSLFLGAPGLTLAALGFVDRKWQERNFWLAVCFLSAFLAMGEFIPGMDKVYTTLPGVALLRFPIKLCIFLILALCVAAQRGSQRICADTSSRAAELLFFLWLAGLVLAVCVHFSCSPAMVEAPDALSANRSSGNELAMWLYPEFRNAAFWALEAGVVTSLFVFATIKGITGWRLPAFVSLFVIAAHAICFLTANAQKELSNTVDAAFFKHKSQLATWLRTDADEEGGFRVLSLLERLPAPRDLALEESGEEERSGFHPGDWSLFGDSRSIRAQWATDRALMQYARELLCANTNVAERISLINGLTVLPTWNSVFLQTGLLMRSSQLPEAHPAGKSDLPLYRYCQSRSTRYVITMPRSPSEHLPFLDRQFFRLVKADPQTQLRVYRTDPVRPRASLISTAFFAASRELALKTINRSDANDFDPLKEVILTELGTPSPHLRRDNVVSSEGLFHMHPQFRERERERERERKIDGFARIERDDRERLEIYAENNEMCFLVLTDSYFPGWKAYDNGKETKILLADGLARAIVLPPGKHRIVFEFLPLSYFVGLALSALSLVIMILLLIADWRKRPASRER